jgi:phage terminase large subunit
MLKAMFEVTKTKIFAKEAPETWFCSARSWSKSADSSQQANSLAGLHADYILFVIDEVGGVPDTVMAAAEAALASGIEAKLLIAGNPTHNEGPLYRASTSESHLWHVVRISSNPDDPQRSTRVSIQWAKEQIEKYGRDNNWVRVNVFGEFPTSSLNTLLGPDEVRAAMGKHLSEDMFSFSQKRLGVDVARFGDDRTVIFPRQGLAAFKPVEMRNARSNEIAARVMQAKYKWNSEVEMVDGSGGYGSGVVDSLLQAGCSPLEVSFSGKPIDNRYFNKRAEMWFLMAEWIKKGGALPNVPELVRELTAIEYTFQNGKFKLEEKQQLKERIGVSPDYADALALTFAIPDQPARQPFDHLTPSRNYQSDWNPYSDDRV